MVLKSNFRLGMAFDPFPLVLLKMKTTGKEHALSIFLIFQESVLKVHNQHYVYLPIKWRFSCNRRTMHILSMHDSLLKGSFKELAALLSQFGQRWINQIRFLWSLFAIACWFSLHYFDARTHPAVWYSSTEWTTDPSFSIPSCVTNRVIFSLPGSGIWRQSDLIKDLHHRTLL